MTSAQLITKILKQEEDIKNLPDLSSDKTKELEKEIISEQVYHSSKIEGSTITLKEIEAMSKDE